MKPKKVKIVSNNIANTFFDSYIGNVYDVIDYEEWGENSFEVELATPTPDGGDSGWWSKNEIEVLEWEV